MKKDLEEVIEIIDDTTEEDDPYHNCKTPPDMKFYEELLKNNYTNEEIYNLTLGNETGILVEYRLLPVENLSYDSENHAMRLKMSYSTVYDYKSAIEDLNLIVDEEYWNNIL